MKCLIKNIKIQAIATYLPTNILEMDSLNDLYGEDNVKMVIKATGVERARIADEKQTASDMCFEAASFLIEKEKIKKEDIDGLVFVSQTADYRAPATSIILQDKLGLSKETVCFDIPYGCSGYIYGIFQAATLIGSGACKKVMVLAGDTTTKLINPKDRAQRMVFGDAGSATIVSSGKGEIGFHIGSDGSEFEKVIVPAGGFRTPSTEETRKEIIDSDGNVRTLDNLYMDGIAVFNFIIKYGQKSIKTLLDYMQWEKKDVKFWAMHQATRFTLNNLRKRLNIDIDKVSINLTNYGNTGPATIPLVLTDICSIESGIDTSQWDKVIMSGYGVGLSWGSIACNLQNTNFYQPLNK
jgi:3-oxoacyl-[acyl-carrier-protein] synthase III